MHASPLLAFMPATPEGPDKKCKGERKQRKAERGGQHHDMERCEDAGDRLTKRANAHGHIMQGEPTACVCVCVDSRKTLAAFCLFLCIEFWGVYSISWTYSPRTVSPGEPKSILMYSRKLRAILCHSVRFFFNLEYLEHRHCWPNMAIQYVGAKEALR